MALYAPLSACERGSTIGVGLGNSRLFFLGICLHLFRLSKLGQTFVGCSHERAARHAGSGSVGPSNYAATSACRGFLRRARRRSDPRPRFRERRRGDPIPSQPARPTGGPNLARCKQSSSPLTRTLFGAMGSRHSPFGPLVLLRRSNFCLCFVIPVALLSLLRSPSLRLSHPDPQF